MLSPSCQYAGRRTSLPKAVRCERERGRGLQQIPGRPLWLEEGSGIELEVGGDQTIQGFASTEEVKPVCHGSKLHFTWLRTHLSFPGPFFHPGPGGPSGTWQQRETQKRSHVSCSDLCTYYET